MHPHGCGEMWQQKGAKTLRVTMFEYQSGFTLKPSLPSLGPRAFL